MTNPVVTILSLSPAEMGHRGPYNAMLAELFPSRVVTFGFSAVFSRQPVLVPFIEESLVRYVAACLLRALLGRRTAGFLFRPLPTLQGQGMRMRAKCAVLKLLRRVPGVTTLTILPFSVAPQFALIADDWIYDLQLWDLHRPGEPSSTLAAGPLATQIRAAAAGRAVCSAIGRQDSGKGFELFVRTWLTNAELPRGMLFAYGGKVDPALRGAADDFAAAGGIGFDRTISDAEIVDLYLASDLVWCVYDPGYDQASGILGRAMQTGVPVAVRRGSLIERLCQLEGHPHLSITDERDGSRLAARMDSIDGVSAAARARRHAEESMRRLRKALGLPRGEGNDGQAAPPAG